MFPVDPEPGDLVPEPPASDRRPALMGWMLAAIGFLLAVRTLTLEHSGPRAWLTAGLEAVTELVGFGLLGWLTYGLLRDAARAWWLAERLVRAWERVAEVPNRGSIGPDHHAGASHRSAALAEIRSALRERRFEEAEALSRAYQDEFPEDPAHPLEELAEARQQHVANLHAQLEAARGVHDPERVIALRDELTLHLPQDAREALDGELVRWLLGLIQRRLLGGSIAPDVVELATRVANSFADTREGASLRASLPTLRRSAGLCSRCGEPYSGLESACPRCLLGSLGPGSGTWVADEDDEDGQIEPGLDLPTGLEPSH